MTTPEPITEGNLDSAVASFYEHYARVVDDQDFEALASLCAPDVRLLLNGDEHHGVDTFIDVYREAMSAAIGSRHLITNIAVNHADRIHARTYLLVIWWSETQTWQGVGYYEDELGWVDGRLVFVDKRIFLERVTDLPVTPPGQ